MQYKSTEGAHWKAMKTKSVELSDRLKASWSRPGNWATRQTRLTDKKQQNTTGQPGLLTLFDDEE